MNFFGSSLEGHGGFTQKHIVMVLEITRHLPNVPSGKRLHNYEKSPCYQWVNPLFRLGHVQ